MVASSEDVVADVPVSIGSINDDKRKEKEEGEEEEETWPRNGRQ